MDTWSVTMDKWLVTMGTRLVRCGCHGDECTFEVIIILIIFLLLGILLILVINLVIRGRVLVCTVNLIILTVNISITILAQHFQSNMLGSLLYGKKISAKLQQTYWIYLRTGKWASCTHISALLDYFRVGRARFSGNDNVTFV